MEFTWFGSQSHANMLKLSSDDCSLLVGDVDVSINPSPVVRDNGGLLDAELTMKQHVNSVARSCFFHFQLRCIRRLRHCVDHNTATQLVSSLALSRLDYFNIVMSGLPKSARPEHCSTVGQLIGFRLHDHITQALKHLICTGCLSSSESSTRYAF